MCCFAVMLEPREFIWPKRHEVYYLRSTAINAINNSSDPHLHDR